MQAHELIERAKTVTGTEAALADVLGVQFQIVSNWKHGRRTCPPDMRARLAELAGLDPVEAALQGIAEGLSDQRRAGLLETLKRAGRAVAIPGLSVLLLGSSLIASPTPANASQERVCIMSNRRRRLAEAISAALRPLRVSTARGI